MEDWNKRPRIGGSHDPRQRGWLVGLRVGAGYTQEALAQKLGISVSTYARIERGVYRGNDQIRAAIAEAIGFPVERWEAEEHGKARPKGN